MRVLRDIAMSSSLLITYKNKNEVYHPFSLYSVLVTGWLPIAKELKLSWLEAVDSILITDIDDAQCLYNELQTVKKYLQSTSQYEPHKAYMIQRIDEVSPLILGAIEEWDNVRELSL